MLTTISFKSPILNLLAPYICNLKPEYAKFAGLRTVFHHRTKCPVSRQSVPMFNEEDIKSHVISQILDTHFYVIMASNQNVWRRTDCSRDKMSGDGQKIFAYTA